MANPKRQARSLRPGQFRHVIRVAGVVGRMPERDQMLLWITHTTGIRVTELAADMAYEGIGELEISREGDVITLRPARPSWSSYTKLPKADDNFLIDRPDVVSDEGRFNL